MPPVHNTQLTLDVEVEYRVLPPEGDLPRQIDITGVFPLMNNAESNRVRRSNILHSLTESELINLEDEIEEEQQL
jgi:hypothetical protein